MIRHVVLMRTRHPLPAEEKETIVRSLRELPSLVPDIRRYSVGFDAGVSDGNSDLAVVADFDDVEGYLRYAGHPSHQEMIAELLRPVLAERVAVQYAVDGPETSA